MAAGGDAEVEEIRRELRDVTRRIVRTGWIVNAVGGAVTFASIGFLIPIFIEPNDAAKLGVRNGPGVLLALVVGGYVLSRWSVRDQRRAFD